MTDFSTEISFLYNKTIVDFCFGEHEVFLNSKQIHGDKVHHILFRPEALLLSWRCQHSILDCILLIWKSVLGFSSVNFSSLNLIKMNLINFTGLSKHSSYFWMRKQVSGNDLHCVVDRTINAIM